jgi:hypothetical protein
MYQHRQLKFIRHADLFLKNLPLQLPWGVAKTIQSALTNCQNAMVSQTFLHAFPILT